MISADQEERQIECRTQHIDPQILHDGCSFYLR